MKGSVQEAIPVVDGASKLPHADSPEQAVICDHDFALVILGDTS
jgi:hypothetical protein